MMSSILQHSLKNVKRGNQSPKQPLKNHPWRKSYLEPVPTPDYEPYPDDMELDAYLCEMADWYAELIWGERCAESDSYDISF